MTQLDFIKLPVYDKYTLAIGDISEYESGFNIVSPARYITPPSFPEKILDYTPSTIEIYKSSSIGITCSDCSDVPLPDGIWKIRQTVNPASTYSIEKTFLKTDRFYEKFNEAFLKLDIMQCGSAIKHQQEKELNTIEFYIEGAIAAANKCANKRAMELYDKAYKALTKFIETQNCDCHG